MANVPSGSLRGRQVGRGVDVAQRGRVDGDLTAASAARAGGAPGPAPSNCRADRRRARPAPQARPRLQAVGRRHATSARGRSARRRAATSRRRAGAGRTPRRRRRRRSRRAAREHAADRSLARPAVGDDRPPERREQRRCRRRRARPGAQPAASSAAATRSAIATPPTSTRALSVPIRRLRAAAQHGARRSRTPSAASPARGRAGQELATRSASSVSPIAAAIAPRPASAAGSPGSSAPPSARSPSRASRWPAARRGRGGSRRGSRRSARCRHGRGRRARPRRRGTAGQRRRRRRRAAPPSSPSAASAASSAARAPARAGQHGRRQPRDIAIGRSSLMPARVRDRRPTVPYGPTVLALTFETRGTRGSPSPPARLLATTDSPAMLRALSADLVLRRHVDDQRLAGRAEQAASPGCRSWPAAAPAAIAQPGVTGGLERQRDTVGTVQDGRPPGRVPWLG